MAKCTICGKEYKPYRKGQITCGDKQCQYEHHKRYLRDYNKARRVEKNEYNKKWMAKNRAEKRAEKADAGAETKAKVVNKKSCENCFWRDYDDFGLADVCVNPRSHKCADFITLDYSCEAWEQEGRNI